MSADESLAALVADLDDSFWSVLLTPLNSPAKLSKLLPRLSEPPPTTAHTRFAHTRCRVEYVDEHCSGDRYQKVLTVLAGSDRILSTAILQDDWMHTDVNAGDTIHIIGSFTQPHPASPNALPPSITINSKENFIILHPDLLVTITALSTASQCRRKPLLSSLVRSSTDYTPALVWGNMLHEVMQTCLSENKWHASYIDEQIELVLSNGLMDLIRINTTIEEAHRELRERSKGLHAFAAKYLSQTLRPEAILTNTRDAVADAPFLLAIADVLDIEEDIWSPTYGLRGKLDATVFAHTAKAPLPSNPFNPGAAPRPNFFNATPAPVKVQLLNSCPTPFEIKTGRPNAGIEHRAQTMLYTLLAEERYGSDVPAGLLYYTQSEEVVRVPRSRNEVRALIVTRNELASWMMKRIRTGQKRGEEVDDEEVLPKVDSRETQEAVDLEEPFLPSTIDNERMCKKCYVLDTCMLYRKAVEGIVDTHSPIADTYELKTSHLTKVHCEFFKKWEGLLSYEERDVIRFKKELWTLRAEERERKGRCFAGMILDSSFDPSQEVATEYDISSQAADSVADTSTVSNVEKIHRQTYRFKRSPMYGRTSTEQESLLNGHINIGDAITISVEPHLLALARGYVLRLTTTSVIVGVDHDLSPNSVMAKLAHTGSDRDDTESIIFRIDRDELFGGMGRMRNNLTQLFYANDEDGRSKRLRELVVDLKAPSFHADVPKEAKKLLKALVVETGPPPNAKAHGAKEQPTWNLNHNQMLALRRIISAQDYALVLGMPGTGKTTVIAALICALVQLGKTVLLTSYTHSAVDTILLRLDAMGSVKGGMKKDTCDFGVLRLGNLDKVHPQVRKYTLAARTRAQTIEQLEGQLTTPPVVATTCLSIDHALFSRRKFDYCIVDEASQITLPTCLGPLRFADTFVLVGDHFQLPPLVRNPAAREGGLDVSLFRQLSDAHPEAIVELAHQYRMNKDIMLLSNKLIYGDRLRCGNKKVAKQSLDIANRSFVKKLHGVGKQGCLAQFELERNGISEEGACWLRRLLTPSTKAVFVDTDLVPAKDSRVGELVQNTVEAELVYQTVESLLRSGVREEQIGIISLYRQQIKLISRLLNHRRGIEILTADRSQGRDKDCIIISMVRSNDTGHVGDLVKDWRRMNVSFTRARRKLVIFGSRSTLQAVQLLDDFFQLMEGNGWILHLPPGADGIHRHSFVTSNDCVMDVDHAVPTMPRALNKRLAEVDEDEDLSKGKENAWHTKSRARKKLKTIGNSVVASSGKSLTGILKGRPILQDLVNEEA
ncbi:hypothetical protein AX15_000763 [Amanita polypyramis BW_CC]|nr:hypothetical protein AX15_000763 [Amanita polypyramis BW_CC]